MSKKKVYILLTDTGTLFTKLIKLYTKKPYNHASISFDSEMSEVYSFGRKTARNPFIGGFVKEDVRKGLFKQADCAIYSFTVTEVDIQKMKRYITEIEAQKEYYRYNFLGLFGVMFNKPLKRKKAFFCSQFVASVLNEGDSVNFEKPPSLIAPNDLQKVFRFQPMYEGKLNAYHKNGVCEKVRVPFQFIPIER
ncbi:hypothetical protein V7112_18025 [Bacillus sp. JJ1566]|uniref:hypothetical protein n=1 Tax=Bacillus sp. JJ1566 TaxID=3122961 RepID=UPI0030005A57